MDTQKYSDMFFSGTFTQADARRRLNILDMVVEEATYKTGEKKSVEELLKTSRMNEEDRVILLGFISKTPLPTTSQDLKKLFMALKEEILKRPVVTLTIAFEPTAEQIIRLGEWFRTNVHKDALLTIVFSAAVVGGCSITWQGKQVTYDLEYLIKAKRKEILAIVDRYVEVKKKEKVI